MIKIGQIGLGDWGKNMFRVFNSHSQCQVVIGCDQDSTIVNRFRENYPTVKFTSNWLELLEEELDAIIIASPPAKHYEMAKAALEKGRHVLVTKPLTLVSQESKELVQMARENTSILMVGHIMVYHPALQLLKQCIDGDELGKVYYFYSTRVNLGKVRSVESALWSYACHDISMIVHLTSEKPLKVSATGAAYLQPNIEDVSFLTIYFTNGVLANIHSSWLDPHKMRKLTIVGEKKMVVFDDTQPAEKIRIYDKGVDLMEYDTFGEYLSLRSGDIFVPKIDPVEPLKNECTHFLKCIQNGTKPLTDGSSGYEVVKILEAAQRSIENEGIPILLD